MRIKQEDISLHSICNRFSGSFLTRLQFRHKILFYRENPANELTEKLRAIIIETFFVLNLYYISNYLTNYHVYNKKYIEKLLLVLLTIVFCDVKLIFLIHE